LSVSGFFESLESADLRRFIDPNTLRLLDAIFGGELAGTDLRRVAISLVDFRALLEEPAGRQLIFTFLPDGKRAEFAMRVGREANQAHTEDWTQAEIGRALDFFGILEERIPPPIPPASDLVKPTFGLFDHQRNVVRRLWPYLDTDERRVLLHLPTGVGKTRTAMHVVAEVLREHEPSVVVWLASTKELLEQAVATFREAWDHLGTRPVQLGSMWGDQMPDLDSFTDGFLAVGLAKAWATTSRTDPDWAARLSQRVRLVVFDEAHQSIANTYRRVTDDLTLDYRCALLGLTATPGRTWADIDKDGELAEFYGGNKVGLEVPAPNPIEYLIQHGYLARPTFKTLFSEPGIKLTAQELRRIAGSLDIPDDIVANLSMSEQYVTAVLGAIEGLVSDGHRRILVFAATVDQALVIAAVLVARGIRAEAVTSTTPVRIRDRIIRAFKSDDGYEMVLVNYGVLTTGFDAPKASAVVIARPTYSLVLYSQMLGRGIRGPKAGGTDRCEVVTVIDPALPGFGDIAAAFLNWEDVWDDHAKN
jgi:superfamily II DNA or RNA helicase